MPKRDELSEEHCYMFAVPVTIHLCTGRPKIDRSTDALRHLVGALLQRNLAGYHNGHIRLRAALSTALRLVQSLGS